MMDDINRLTAQTIAAEEAIAYRDDQIKKLKDENLKMKDEIDNTVPILKAQVGTGLDKQKIQLKMSIFSYPSVLTHVLGAQKNRLIETVLLSTHNICFG